MTRLFPRLILILITLIAPPGVWAAQGVSPDVVAFAQVVSPDLQGGPLGRALRQGIVAAFEEANRDGGVHGRRVRLETVETGADAAQTLQQVGRMIGRDRHLAVIGPLWNASGRLAHPMLRDAGWPLVDPFASGARQPGSLRAGRGQTLRCSAGIQDPGRVGTEGSIRYLVDQRGFRRIAILFQDDAFGRSGRDAVRAALGSRGLPLIASGRYTRDTLAVKAALLDIRRARPEAVILVATSAPVAEFIRRAGPLGLSATFVILSSVAQASSPAAGADESGCLVSRLVPFPWDAENRVVNAYLRALRAVDPRAEPGFVSLQGYVGARLAVAALKAAGPDPTRQGFLAALERHASLLVGDWAQSPPLLQSHDEVGWSGNALGRSTTVSGAGS